MNELDISCKSFHDILCFYEILDSYFDVQNMYSLQKLKNTKSNFLLNLINKMNFTNEKINEISVLPIIISKIKEYLNNSNSNKKIMKIAYYPDPVKSIEEQYNNNLLNYAPSIFKTLYYNDYSNIELKLVPITTDDILQGKLTLFDSLLVPGK